MALGHVKLDGRPYQLVDINRYVDALANQMSPKISQGEQRYSALDTWSAWIQSDWQQGLGHVRPAGEDTGYLFGECDTRVPHQIILPPQLQVSDGETVEDATTDTRFIPTAVTGSYTLTTTGPQRRVRQLYHVKALDVSDLIIAVYARIPAGSFMSVGIYQQDQGDMGELIANALVGSNIEAPGFYWWAANLGGIDLTPDSTYYLVVEPFSASDTVEVAYATRSVGPSSVYNGTTWTEQTGKSIPFLSNQLALGTDGWADESAALGAAFFRFNGETYYIRGNSLYSFDNTSNVWNTVGTAGTSANIVYSVAVFGPTVYIATDEALYTMNTSETISDSGLDARLLLQYKGFLWRTDGQNLYYTADGGTWVGPFAMGGSDVVVRGMAGMEGDMYCATDKALMRLAPGDVVEEVFRFGAEDAANGLNMLEKDNALYIPAGGRVFRYGPDGVLLDIWAGRSDDLPRGRLGRIDALCRMNQWLVALVNAQGEGEATRPTVLAYQTEGWHPLTTLPNERNPLGDATNMALFYDRENSRLWIACNSVGPLYLDIPDYALNPYNLDDYRYEASAWIEWDWFDGSIRELLKDYDSVQVVGEGLSSDTYADLYWQDDDSTEWEYLGRFDRDGKEIRWEYPYTDRPITRRIKLGLRLATKDTNATPRIDAIRLKYHTMTKDWFRFTLPIMVSGVPDTMQQLSDGSVQEYTGEEQMQHLRGLATQELPFLYQDPLGVTYEVKVQEAVFQLTEWDRLPDFSVRWNGVYTLTLEQITPGVYDDD